MNPMVLVVVMFLVIVSAIIWRLTVNSKGTDKFVDGFKPKEGKDVDEKIEDLTDAELALKEQKEKNEKIAEEKEKENEKISEALREEKSIVEEEEFDKESSEETDEVSGQK